VGRAQSVYGIIDLFNTIYRSGTHIHYIMNYMCAALVKRETCFMKFTEKVLSLCKRFKIDNDRCFIYTMIILAIAYIVNLIYQNYAVT
jgi:hypothetical protein